VRHACVEAVQPLACVELVVEERGARGASRASIYTYDLSASGARGARTRHDPHTQYPHARINNHMGLRV